MVEVEYELELEAPIGAPEDHVVRFLSRMAEDAGIGTFDEFRDFAQYGIDIGALQRQHGVNPQWDDVEWLRSDGYRQYWRAKCTLQFPDANLNLTAGGIGFLVGSIAGDILGTQYLEHKIVRAKLRKLALPDVVIRQLGGPNVGMERVRELLRLEQGMPLVAFSIKPRVGLTPEQLAAVSRDVAAGGVQIIEDDTRLGDSQDSPVIARAVAVTRALADMEQTQGRKFCYSPNLTGAGANVIEAFHRIDDAIRREVGKGLGVVKLDVLPAGYGALEALRRHFQTIGREVVITVYPSMYAVFDPVIDRTITLQLARLAGADILYPGRPVILAPGPRRIDANQLNRVVKRYYPVLLREMPGIKRTMPTVAGGIKPADIRMYYEFAGPCVGFFIGGGIAAVPGGPGKGARYCIQAAKCAARGLDFVDERDLTLAELESVGWYAPDVKQILREDPDLSVYLWRHWRGQDGLPG